VLGPVALGVRLALGRGRHVAPRVADLFSTHVPDLFSRSRPPATSRRHVPPALFFLHPRDSLTPDGRDVSIPRPLLASTPLPAKAYGISLVGDRPRRARLSAPPLDVELGEYQSPAGRLIMLQFHTPLDATTSRIAEIETDDGCVVRIIDGPTAISGIGRCLGCAKRWTSASARGAARNHTTETGHSTLVDTIRFKTETFGATAAAG